MKNAWLIILFIALTTVSCGTKVRNSSTQEIKPNIIYILADDLGYGDLSCYGQTNFATPNIDALAKEGILFTQHYSGSTVCAPSRSALMTGLHTGHTYIRGNHFTGTIPKKNMVKGSNEGQIPIPDSVYTIAELLKEQGYKTGAFGKWGLGYPGSEGDPLNQGFNTFYGYNCQKLGHHYYPYHLWSNEQKVFLKGNADTKKEQYAPYLIHNEAIKFIENNKDKPFFLYYPSIIPHAELAAPKAYMDKFIGKYNPEKSYVGHDEGEDYRQGKYESQKYPHAAFAAMIKVLDDQVGELVKKVKDLGLEENTIFIFTSDNGPHKEGGADPDYFNSNGILKGYKRDLYEGGIRVPMIAKWKGKIKEGTKTDHISAFWDIMPTFAELSNTKLKRETDGISFLPTLLGDVDKQKQHDYLYWEFHEQNGRQAIRKDNWKLVKYNVKRKPQYALFDLGQDPSEEYDLSEEKPEKLRELVEILKNSRTDSKNFKF